MSEKKYWITMDKSVWAIVLIITAIVFFPAFVVLLVLWAIDKIKINI